MPGRDVLFTGDSDLPRAMAATDWAATPLGPSPQWPAELRTVVRLLLTSRFSMWMAWGPELTMLYNDAYFRDTLRAKHPWALGRPAREVWSEIWDDIGPRIRSVLDTGTATWDERLLLFLERSGYPEETYHTFSYSPLAGPGGIDGMLCVVTEDTERVLSARRIATLRELAAATTAARTHDEVAAAVVAALGGNRRDVPYALVHRFEGSRVTLVASSGVEEAPAVAWPVDRLRAGEAVLLDEPGGVVTAPGAAWERPPREAAAVPLLPAGGGLPLGFLVVGLNPFRSYDDGYRTFVELMAGQIASGLRTADAYEAERDRAESLAELDRAKTVFFSNISHEFRTPLTLIMGPVEDLRAAGDIAEGELRETLEVVHRNGERLARLVNSLLDVARLEAGGARADLVPLDLARETADLAAMFRSATERAGLELVIDCPPLPGPVWVDRDMWERVVLNLLSNALKFTLTGSITVRVRMTGGEVVTEVADTGVGIPAAELDSLFERFHQVRGRQGRSVEGSGIGLALARDLVQLHGGTITVESQEGRSSTFTVRIPVGTKPAAEPLPPPAERPGAGSYVGEALRWVGVADGAAPAVDGGQAPRVLVAEDNADLRDYLNRLLARRYRVQTVGDGAEALASARADPPDIVVTDVMMPGLDGTELLARLRSDPATARIPVVVLSARAGPEAAVGGMAAGADDYLVKPFDGAELLARVEGHLRLGRARRESEERFRSLADSTPAMIWVEGPGEEREFANRAWLRFVGADRTDPGLSWRDRIHPEDRPQYERVRATAATVAAPFAVEYRMRAADGRYRWVSERGAAAVPASRGWVGGCLDIDERHRDRDRQRVLLRLGTELDRPTTVAGRRAVLLRDLVELGLATAVTFEDDTPAEPPAGALIVALSARGRAFGRLVVTPAGEAEPQLWAAIAERAGTALDNAHLLERERATAGRLRLLQRATAALSAAADPSAVARVAVRQFRELLGATGAGLWELRDGVLELLDDDGALPAAVWADWGTVPLATDTPAAAALASRGGLWLVEDADWARWPDLQAVSRGYGYATSGFVPLLIAEGALGVVGVAFAREGGPAEEERAAAAALADQCALALGRARLLAAESEARLAAETLGEVVGQLAGATTAADVAGVARRWALARGAEEAIVAQLRGGVLDVIGDSVVRLELAGLLGHAVRTGRPRWPARAGTEEPEWDVALPLKLGEQAIGVIGMRLPPDTVAFTPGERAAVLTLAGQFAQALDRAWLHETEHEVAEVLQRSLLPDTPPRLARLDVAVRYLPGAAHTQAGGDWYDVLRLPDADGTEGSADGRVAIVVGDVVGHGPPAAGVMGKLSAALAGFLLEGHSPAAALERLDRVAARTPGARGSTCVCLVLDPRRHELTWARAGHVPPLIVTDGGVRVLDEGDGVVLGVSGRPPYREAQAELPPGARVLAFTDGLVERRGEVVDAGLERLVKVVSGRPAEPGESLADGIVDGALAGAPRDDDVALVVARLVPEPLRLRLRAEPSVLSGARRRLGAWAERAGLPPAAADDLTLMVSEALTNAIEHAYPGEPAGEVDAVVARAEDGSVSVRVRDFGRWRPPPSDPGHRGRGLLIMRALAEDLSISHGRDGDADGTELAFRFTGAPA